MPLSQDQIAVINKKCRDLDNSYKVDQGVLKQPTGVPTKVKDMVVVTRYSTGGVRGGGYGSGGRTICKSILRMYRKINSMC